MNADTLMDDTDQDSIDSFNYTSVPTYTERENNSFIGSENNSGNQSGTSSEKNSIPLDKQTLKTAEMLKENIENLEDVFSAARNSDEESSKSRDYHSHQSNIAGENKPYNSVEEEFIADNMDNTTTMSSNLNSEKKSTALKPVSSSSSLSTKESDSTKSRKRKR